MWTGQKKRNFLGTSFSCSTKGKKGKVFDFRFQTIASELKQMQLSCKIKKKGEEVIIGRRISVASQKNIYS
jgi:hypothetical protein